MPFENDIEDKRAFSENIYTEIFGKSQDVFLICRF